MSDSQQLEASRTIKAPADRIFAVLSDPKQHTAIDGSGLLQGSDSEPLTSVGQTFAMKLHRDDMGDWQTFSTVTELQPNSTIGWKPSLDPDCDLATALAHMDVGGQTFTYRLRESGDGTEVTQVYDWSGATDPQFIALCPFVSQEELAATLDRLADAVEG